MIKAEFAQKLQERTGLSLLKATEAVNVIFDEIANAMIAKENIYIRGLGTFACRYSAPKKARNISTNETIDVAPTPKVKFKPSPALVELMKENWQKIED